MTGRSCWRPACRPAAAPAWKKRVATQHAGQMGRQRPRAARCAVGGLPHLVNNRFGGGGAAHPRFGSLQHKSHQQGQAGASPRQAAMRNSTFVCVWDGCGVTSAGLGCLACVLRVAVSQTALASTRWFGCARNTVPCQQQGVEWLCGARGSVYTQVGPASGNAAEAELADLQTAPPHASSHAPRAVSNDSCRQVHNASAWGCAAPRRWLRWAAAPLAATPATTPGGCSPVAAAGPRSAAPCKHPKPRHCRPTRHSHNCYTSRGGRPRPQLTAA